MIRTETTEAERRKSVEIAVADSLMEGFSPIGVKIGLELAEFGLI